MVHRHVLLFYEVGKGGGCPNPWEGGDSSKPMLDYAADEKKY